MITHFESPQGFRYHRRHDGLYQADMPWRYLSVRYCRLVKIKEDQVRDGASGAKDIESLAWWVHDQLCAEGAWYDRSDVTPWQAAMVLYDILREEGRWFRARTWLLATYFAGCRRAHEEP